MIGYDAAVIGDGPAALAAAINLKIRKKSFVLFGTPKGSHKVLLSPGIDNYLGFPEITGSELMEKMTAHAESLGVEWNESRVNQVYHMGSHYAVLDKDNAQYEVQTVIVATGVDQSGKVYPGENELLGKGLSYCATCDGLFFKEKTVAVLGQNDEAVHDANYLTGIAAKVYYIPLKKVSAVLNDTVEVIAKKVTAVKGTAKVEGLVFADGELTCDGVFILRDAVSPSYLVPGIAVEEGHLKIDACTRTNMPGIFAAGDVTGRPYQLMKAVGQGQTAALMAVSYLDELKDKQSTNK
jgi:thioredoxin reductase (NADPH)